MLGLCTCAVCFIQYIYSNDSLIVLYFKIGQFLPFSTILLQNRFLYTHTHTHTIYIYIYIQTHTHTYIYALVLFYCDKHIYTHITYVYVCLQYANIFDKRHFLFPVHWWTSKTILIFDKLLRKFTVTFLLRNNYNTIIITIIIINTKKCCFVCIHVY